MSPVREGDAGKAFALTGLPPSPGKAICLPGLGKAFGLVGVRIGVEGGRLAQRRECAGGRRAVPCTRCG